MRASGFADEGEGPPVSGKEWRREGSAVSFAATTSSEIRSLGTEEVVGAAKPKSNKSGAVQVLRAIFWDSGALKLFGRNFLLMYNIRSGVALVLRVLRLLRSNPRKVLSISDLVSEGNLVFRAQAVRLGLFVGGFSFLYRSTYAALYMLLRSKAVSSAFAGTVAGGALGFMSKDWHRTLALYLGTRALECAFNVLRSRGAFKGVSLTHGDAWLFALSSAQVMYAYVMRPETLPESYYKFIVRQGPVDETILKAVRANNRGLPLNADEIMSYVRKKGGAEAVARLSKTVANPVPKSIPIELFHPSRRSSVVHTALAFVNVVKQIFPVYFSLSFAPAVALRSRRFFRDPLGVLKRSLSSATQSSAFLATFCSGYQALIVCQRWFIQGTGMRDHKLVYWLAGLLCSASILIERKSRRSELALYAFPRGVDSLYQIMYDNKLVGKIKNGTIILFALSMGAIMLTHDQYPEEVSPLVGSILRRCVDYDPLAIRRVDSTASELGASARPLGQVPAATRMSTTQFL